MFDVIADHEGRFVETVDLDDSTRGSEFELVLHAAEYFAAEDPVVAARYSALMADGQRLVAEETLRAVSFLKTGRLMDVGGGTGVFLASALKANPGMTGTLFDLPAVVSGAPQVLRKAGVEDRVRIVPGSFRDADLPEGADTISLVRVLYDHEDQTVEALLRKVFEALPPGGRLVVAEPMSGGATPERAGDAYFALYTMAMGTGRTRSAGEISRLMSDAGFASVRPRRTHRPFVTSAVTGVRPG